MSHGLAVARSILASTLAGWRGSLAYRPARRQPEQWLRLYEFEACPYCRLVREVLTELDLDALILPCPPGGRRFRPEAEHLGGRAQFPFLVDPNTGTQLYESAEIIDYLARTYEGRLLRPVRGWRRATALSGSMLASLSAALPRPRGGHVRPSRAPAQPLELYSFESSPYSRLVREVLCELELPYRLRSFGKSTPQEIGPPAVRRKWFPEAPIKTRNRQALMAATGRLQVPYLVDPNTGTALFESAAIMGYLEQTYAA
ncbi:MAG TPA: glutathione S-transferase N-terminal domain-containing protein [Nevskiaceae bacterium]|nr:glutathione S-transferase N-terminal domain-containing protein [Nevskiaceae bacterium]